MTGDSADKPEAAVPDQKSLDLELNPSQRGGAPDERQEPSPRDRGKGLPRRYAKTKAEGREVITCREAPNLQIRIERGLTFSESSARKAAPGSIFLDGAAQAPPFLDPEKHLYNFDHHEGCVRPFTLSTCEQVYIFIRQGLNLRDREWTVYANDPDLDTLLAIWLLLNHSRISGSDPEGRLAILPLIRLEGVIDVHGLDLQELACLSPELFKETSARISELISKEMALKRDGAWNEMDFVEYSMEILSRIDVMFYSPWEFEGFKIVDEIMRVSLSESQIAVVCHSESGIYEVEQQLRAIHGQRLGIIALQREEGQYTLRQVHPFLSGDLRRVYARLNLLDPAVGGENRWGGSDAIGGSPRKGGSRLSPEAVGDAILRAFRPFRWNDLAMSSLTAILATLGAVLLGVLTAFVVPDLPHAFIVGFLGATAAFLAISARKYPRLYGFKLPTGWDWLYASPAVLLGGILGGSPLNPPGGEEILSTGAALLFMVGSVVSAELLFRSLVHGLLAEELRIQRSDGRWFLSWPVVGSSVLFLLVSLLTPPPPSLQLPASLFPALEGIVGGSQAWAIRGFGSILLGLGCGLARERAESLLAPVFLHLLVAILLLALT